MKYKEFVFIGSSFRCDKNCPYCTAKITKWPVVSNKVELVREKLKLLMYNDIRCRYFIFSGNGEPSLLSLDDFKTVIDAVKEFDIFDEKRIQSSGNLFYDDDKFNLVKDDFIVEVTRVSIDSSVDREVLGYERDYIKTDNFKKAKIRLNYVMLKNKSFKEYLEEIKYYINNYSNIETVSLKTLNMNTKESSFDNVYSKWILENALTKKDTEDIINFMNINTEFLESDEEFFDRYEWSYLGVPITFYAKKQDYGLANIVYYGGELVDYKLNKLELKKGNR